MPMPHAAKLRVDRSKVVDYLLSEFNSRGKATFFLRYGFRPEAWETLAAALTEQARNNPVVAVVDSAHGSRYSVNGDIETPSGRQPHPRVRTVWILEQGSSEPRLITAYPVQGVKS